jgi:putative membrane protein
MTQPPSTSNQLAELRTDLALGRTIMALERTLMAWLRTGVALISFGFTIFKFMDALLQKGSVNVRENAPRNLGVFLILLGMGLLIVGIIEYSVAKKKILADSDIKPPFSFSLLASLGILVVGVLTLMNIFFGFGGF